LDAVGVIDELYERDALVSVGSLKTVVSHAELRRAPSPETRPEIQRTGVSGVAAPELTATEIDVRGLRVDEAMPIVDKALDSASLAGVSELRIIHGKGTGQLGRGLREFLRDHPQAAGFAQAGDKEGGSGVTIVTVR
jgi:DNA mismatch repair protein MutS2